MIKYVYPTTHVVLGIINTGRRTAIRCPSGNHKDKTASLVIYPDGGFNCYGCSANGGNGLDFLIKVLGNSYGESMDYLREKGLLTKIE